MNKKFEEFIDETKQRLLAYEMDESAFSECYDDNDRQMMERLREALYEINRDKLNNLPTEDFVDAILGRMITSNGVTECELDLDLIKQDLVMWLNMEVEDGNK